MSAVVILALAAVFVGLMVLDASSLPSIARRADVPLAERRVTPPTPVTEPKPTNAGYRDPGSAREEPAPKPRGPIVLDGRRYGTKTRRVVAAGAGLAVRVNVGRSTILFARIEATRDGDDVVMRAFYVEPPRRRALLPDWRERLEAELVPMLESLLEDVTGVRPAALPRTRVDVADVDDEDHVAARRALERRGWPKG